MSDKTPGVDFDRAVFVQPRNAPSRPSSQFTGLIFVVVGIAAIIFLGYKLLPMALQDHATASDPTLADIDKRLTAMEGRLEKLETTRRASVPVKSEEQAAPETASAKPVVKTIYRISPPPAQQSGRTRLAPTPAQDPAIAQRLSTLQQNLGSIQSNEVANQEAWQATTNKLADMAGQVGTQGVEILRSQDELDQLLARTEMEAIPFELLRRSNPQPVGPVALVLKSTNAKSQRYTLCVMIQPSCIQLKDRTLLEVVTFVVSRNTAPLEVIATKITKDEMLGYLEVPKSVTAHP